MFQFGVTLSGAVLISLLEAVTLTPMRCSQFVHVADETKGFSHFVKTQMGRLIRLLLPDPEMVPLVPCGPVDVPGQVRQFALVQIPRFQTFLYQPQIPDSGRTGGDQKSPIFPGSGDLVRRRDVVVLPPWLRPGNPWPSRSLAPLFLLVILVYLWKDRHFLFAHLLYDHRWWVVFGAMVIFAGSMFLAKIIKKEMVPSTDQSVFMLNLQLPVDYSIFRTDEIVKQCEALLKEAGGNQKPLRGRRGFRGNVFQYSLHVHHNEGPGEKGRWPPGRKNSSPPGPWVSSPAFLIIFNAAADPGGIHGGLP